jgi:hypothetical protein
MFNDEQENAIFDYNVMWSLYLNIAINTAKLCITYSGITSAINEFQVEYVYFLFQKLNFGNL